MSPNLCVFFYPEYEPEPQEGGGDEEMKTFNEDVLCCHGNSP